MDIYDILKEFTLEDALEIEEKYDKQYIYLKKLYENIKDKEKFVKICLINALLSYQLTYKGEEFWKKFSEFFSKKNIDICNDFREFIEKYNYRLKENKIKRLNKICNWILNQDLFEYKDNLIKLNIDLAKYMNQRIYDKTIVFSVKIYGYCLRIIGYKIIFPTEIFIPIDNRISKISKDREFWIDLSKKLNIPLLHLDSIIWVTYGMKEDEIERIDDERLREKVKKLKRYLNNLLNAGAGI